MALSKGKSRSSSGIVLEQRIIQKHSDGSGSRLLSCLIQVSNESS